MRCVISNLQFDFLLVCWCRLTLRLLLSFSAKFSLFEKIFGKTWVLRQLKALQLNVTLFFSRVVLLYKTPANTNLLSFWFKLKTVCPKCLSSVSID